MHKRLGLFGLMLFLASTVSAKTLHSTVLLSVENKQENATGSTSTMGYMSDAVTGSPDYVHFEVYCTVLGVNGFSITNLSFYDENDNVLLNYKGCEVGGTSNSEGVRTSNSFIIPIPEGTFSFKQTGTLYNVHGSTGTANSKVSILGKPFEGFNFTNAEFFGVSGQNPSNNYTISDSGFTITLERNTWVYTPFEVPLSVTPRTVMEFDFKSTAQGETHAIGFFHPDGSNSGRSFRLYGTQKSWGRNYEQYLASEGDWQHYKIYLGNYLGGTYNNLVFINDDDAYTNSNSQFRNIEIYEY